VYIAVCSVYIEDFSVQIVMVDSWKEWTGARHIYMYLPDELGLSRISLYKREAPQSLNMFLYVVLVECTTVRTIENQVNLGLIHTPIL
jgi:hypothetical protein